MEVFLIIFFLCLETLLFVKVHDCEVEEQCVWQKFNDFRGMGCAQYLKDLGVFAGSTRTVMTTHPVLRRIPKSSVVSHSNFHLLKESK